MNTKDPIIVKLPRRVSIVHIILLTLVGVVTAMACGWSYITDHSVRFNSFRSGRGFYRLPPLPIMYDKKTGKELSVNEIFDDENNLYGQKGDNDQTDSLSLHVESQRLWDHAQAAIDKLDLNEAQGFLEKLLTLTNEPTIDDEPERQQRRNSAVDMLDALTALKHGSKVSSVKAYLDARNAYDLFADRSIEDLINQAPRDNNLADNWTYLSAADHLQRGEKEAAADLFRKLAKSYPNSEKNESALFMAAKVTMESSIAFGDSDCVADETESDNKNETAESESAKTCRDDNWHAAIKDFQEVMRKYPSGRYFDDSHGWLAYLYIQGGERAKGLAEYYRMLGDPKDRSTRLKAKKSLQVLGHRSDDATLDQLEKLIAGEPETAMAYAYHRIYNYAVDSTYQKVEFGYSSDSSYGNDRKKEVAQAHDAGNHELARIVNFATAVMKRYPASKVSAGFVLRVAEAQVELRNYSEALVQARKALSIGLQAELKPQALWIKGSCEHQARDFKAARGNIQSTHNRISQRQTDGRC